MTPNHSFYVPFVEEADRTLMRHLTAMLVIVTTLFAGAVELHRFYSQKFHDTTAPAKWIWCRTRMSRGSALAFFATREFDLPPNRNYTKIKIAADPQYTLYFNGREIAGRETAGERTVDVYDVSALARDGRNRIVVAMRSANGVGGLLVSVDITRELENFVVTDDRWRIATAWAPGLPLRDPRSTEPPMIIGEPPVGRWNFPGSRRGEFTTTSGTTLAPREAAAYIARLPEVKVISGVAV
ncbi:MAG TPA: hypothetical protein VNL91_04135, partial [Thermoanaerobaculia bacterium]|nr:hypothetical protein [Thermoanaerobaculia bacterium]